VIILLILAAALGVAVVTALAFVVSAIRREPRGTEPGTWAPSPMAAMVRCLTGLHVRRPGPAHDADSQPDARLAGFRKGR
jgi:hypothetical protein